jgi:hypothetical protein
MSEPGPASAGAEVTINADSDAVYALITDLPTLASLGDEVAEMTCRKQSRPSSARGRRLHLCVTRTARPATTMGSLDV